VQNYLRPDLLEAAGVANINDWGATFTATVNTVQVNATGTRLRPITRVGKFCNLSELLAISSIFRSHIRSQHAPPATAVSRRGDLPRVKRSFRLRWCVSAGRIGGNSHN
jgi:hypothetical protein